ncbi:hypothetical protein KKH39_05020 [Patescibacteria group bacterium]|nr:hypothetical protein [Patescibacteria group bacterium]
MTNFIEYFLFIFLIFPFSCQAVGISVSPSSLEMFYPSVGDSYIDIQNISEEPIVVYIYTDDYKDNFVFNVQEMELYPEEISRVALSVDFKNSPEGLKYTNISVLTKALDKKSFNAFSGLKIPTTVYVTKSFFYWTKEAVFVGVFFGILLLLGIYNLLFIIIRHFKRKKHFLSSNLLKKHKKWYKLW